MPSDEVVACIIPADRLRTFFGVLTPIVSECKLHMGDEGWHVSVVDPANHAMVESLDLPPRAFDHYESPGQATVGVNIERLLDYVSPAGADDLVEFRIDMETRKLRINFEQTETGLALIDPETIRSEPDSPDLDLGNEFVLTGDKLDHIITMADLVAESVMFIADPDERELRFRATGDTDDTEITYTDEHLIDARIQTETEQTYYGLQLLGELSTPIPSDAEVTMRYDKEFPLRMQWSDLDGDMTVEQLLAPRIKST